MRKDDLELLREIQKNAEYISRDIDLLTQKVDEEELALQLSRHALKLSAVSGKASHEILNGRGDLYHENGFEEMIQKRKLQASTILNTSNSHIADVMIRENQNSIANVWRAQQHYSNASEYTMEIAQELVDIEEKFIYKLKRFL